VRNPVTIFAAKGFQRIWPPVMIGAIFVIQVLWIILFLLYLSIAFVGLAFRPLGAVILRARASARF
jgi:hypothetical protein